MATFSEVRDALNSLETVRLRGEELQSKRSELIEQIARLETDILQIAPAIKTAEDDFKALVASLDFGKA